MFAKLLFKAFDDDLESASKYKSVNNMGNGVKSGILRGMHQEMAR